MELLKGFERSTIELKRLQAKKEVPPIPKLRMVEDRGKLLSARHHPTMNGQKCNGPLLKEQIFDLYCDLNFE
jgi:hypothetical protein